MPSLGDSTSQTRRDYKTIALFQLSSRTFSQRKGVRGSQSVDIKSSTKPSAFFTSRCLPCQPHFHRPHNPSYTQHFSIRQDFQPGLSKMAGDVLQTEVSLWSCAEASWFIGPSHLQLPDQHILVVHQLFEADQTG